MPFSAGLLRRGAIAVAGQDVNVDIRLPWMRSLPWRCIQGVVLTLDGRELPPAEVRLKVGDRRLESADLSRLDGYWTVGTPVTLTAKLPPDPADRDVAVRVAVNWVLPYVEGPPALTATAEDRVARAPAER